MKAFLMYKDQDFDLQRQLPSNEQALTQDLELNTLFHAMALGETTGYRITDEEKLKRLAAERTKISTKAKKGLGPPTLGE